MTIASGSNLLGVSFPDDWLRSKIGRITTKVGSGATPKGGASVYQATGIPLIRSLNVHNEGFRSYNLAFINDDHARQLEYASVEPGDVLLNITGASILRSAVVPAEVGPARVNQHVSILRPDTNQVLPGYLHAWLISPAMYSYMYSQSVGSTREAITKEQILRFPMVLPTLEEQRAIVGFLDAKTAEIDGLVEKLQREVELLERYRRELIAYTVTRGLDPDVPMKDSGIDWVGVGPATWTPVSAKAIFMRRTEFERASDVHLTPSQMFGVLPQEEFIAVSGVKPTLKLSDSGKMKHVDPGDFIIHLRSFQGGLEYSEYQGKVSAAYTVITPRNDQLADRSFFRWLFKSTTFIKNLSSMTNQLRDGQSINFKTFSRTSYLLPPLVEQQEIAAFLNEKTLEIDSAISGIKRQIELLRRYRKQVINDAVTGKVRVGGVA